MVNIATCIYYDGSPAYFSPGLPTQYAFLREKFKLCCDFYLERGEETLPCLEKSPKTICLLLLRQQIIQFEAARDKVRGKMEAKGNGR